MHATQGSHSLFWSFGRCIRGGRFAAQLCLRDQHIRGHAWNIGALGIVEAHLENDGLDVALLATYVSLSGEICFRGLEENFPASDRSSRKADAQGVANANVISVCFSNRSAN